MTRPWPESPVAPPLVDGTRGWADASRGPSWPPQDGSPYRVHRYDPYDVIQIWLRIDGIFQIGVLYEHADWGEPVRRLVRPFFTPVLPSGERDCWLWWEPDRMRLNSRSPTSTLEEAGSPYEGDAVRYRPYPRPSRGPAPHTVRYGIEGLRGEIRVGGAWRTARIFTRDRWSDGTQSCEAHVYLPEPAWGAHVRYQRHYLWNARTIRLATEPRRP